MSIIEKVVPRRQKLAPHCPKCVYRLACVYSKRDFKECSSKGFYKYKKKKKRLL